MTVLVTGGTGDLGRRLVPRLERRGADVIVGSRRPTDRDRRYDLDEVPDLAGVDVVVHLASDPEEPRREPEAMARLVTAAERAGVGHVLFLSIVGVDDHPLAFYRAKAEAEAVLAGGPVPWTVQRATQFHSFVPRLATLLRRGPLTIVPRGYRIQPIDADAVADRVADIVAGGPAGRARDIGGPQVVAVSDVVRSHLRRTGRGGPVLSVPVPGALGAAFAGGMHLLGPEGEVLGAPYDAHMASDVR